MQAAVPWARPGSGFTLMMEAVILLLGQQMSVSAAARHLGESDKRLWRVLEHYVMEAHLAKDWSQLRRLMIDETSARKGHRYVTVVLDAESHDLLFMVEGRSAQAITEFLAAMPAHGAKAEAITEVVMDMSPAYIAGVQTHFPNARIVFDLFHIMKLAGEALDFQFIPDGEDRCGIIGTNLGGAHYLTACDHRIRHAHFLHHFPALLGGHVRHAHGLCIRRLSLLVGLSYQPAQEEAYRKRSG